MKRTYEVAEQGDKRGLAEFLKRESQFLLPMVELVERTELAIAEVILAPPISLDSRLAATTGSRKRGCFDVSQAWGLESDRRS